MTPGNPEPFPGIRRFPARDIIHTEQSAKGGGYEIDVSGQSRNKISSSAREE
jgi:hypothetical protein